MLPANKNDRILDFFNRADIFKRLYATLNFVIGGQKVDFELKIGGGSYTDGEKVVVGLPEIFNNKPIEEIYGALQSLTGHEGQHVKSSNFKELKKYMERMTAYFLDLKLYSQVSEYISHSMANILEDGRIENILCKKLPGYIPKIRFLNMSFWELGNLEGLDDLRVYINSVLSLATLGIYPKGYHAIASEEVKNEIEKIRPLIFEAVEARTAKECLLIAEEIITDKSKDFLLKHIERINKDLEAFNQIIEMLEQLVQNQHQNSEESETQDSKGRASHIVVKVGKNNKESSSNEKSDKKTDKADKDKKPKDKNSPSEEDSEDKSKKENSKDNSKKDDTNLNGDSGSEKSDSASGDTDGEGTDQMKGSKSKQKGSPKENSTSTQLSEGMNSETFDEESRSEEDFANDIKKLREDIVNDVKLEMTKIKRESVVDQKAKQYSITQDEYKEMAKDFGFGGNFKEVPNDFPLTHALPPEIKVAANKFRRSVEHIFKNKKQVTLRNQETGIIDVNDLYRVAMKDYNVFKEEGRKTTSNYVAFILQDGSGSMRGTKEVYSAHALSVIEEGLRDIIPFKTATFCSEGGGIRHYVVRGWNDKSKNNYSINFLKSRYANGGNDDDKSIMVAAKELMKRPEKDKILIVLSDGLPSSEENTKNAIKKARDMGIHVVGIMFGDESFRESNIDRYKKMYEKNIISTSPDKIGDRLVEVFKKILVR